MERDEDASPGRGTIAHALAIRGMARAVATGMRVGAWCRDLVVPDRCVLCLAIHDGGFCHSCHELLPWIGIACESCRRPLAHPGTCGDCQRARPPWQGMVVPFHYADPVSRLLHRLKYDRCLRHVAPLAMALAEQVHRQCAVLPDVIAPVPLHPRKLRSRGFNQSALLARETGRLLGVAVDQDLLIRTRETPSQTRLDVAAREKNLHDAFAVRGAGRYDAVAIIDDVITSGATLRATCRALRRQGLSQIDAWAIARA